MLRPFATLTDPLRSPSGRWALRYDADGRAVISDEDGATTWTAGAPGTLRFELPGVLAVYQDRQVVWRGDLPVQIYSSFAVTDEGDGMFYDHGFPLYSLRKGPVEPYSLGDRAPVAEIHSRRFLESSSGKRTVHREAATGALICKTKIAGTAAGVFTIPPAAAQALDRPDTWLTWRFLDENGTTGWAVTLVGPGDEVLWTDSRLVGDREPADGEPVGWLQEGLGSEYFPYCVTVIHDVDPDEALRRFGADDSEISTSTWAELLRRSIHEDAFAHHVVAAFALGPHALLVEYNGWSGANRPELSRGTFAVSSSSSVNGDSTFLVSRDGETLTRLNDILADDLDLLSRVADVRPAAEDLRGPARVAILPWAFPPR
ncbi:DUF6461 domain-containing protein [Amycolatopsis jejuensis]|uniref:DUF6461 domain-containing protein n=1 Tax=Amycolatopsis jejuensis TaxID=330084 RepID=UPI0005254C9E|nr:DUF6461 domain-containing protein [Amycolatopsis jejuensis]